MSKRSAPIIHYRTCNLCEAMCGIEVAIQDGQIQSIKGDKDDPFSKGYICPKATALQDIYEDPDRLHYPVKKTPEGWQEISWREAFDLVEQNLKRIQSAHGANALGIYLGNPNVHNLGSMLFGAPMIRALKTKNRFSATSVDQLPHHFAAQFMFGHMGLLPIPDIDRTHFFLCIGANPMISNGSLMSAGGMPEKIKELKARGGKMIVVDPRRTETAQKADEHHFIRPGKDVYFLAAMVHVLLRDDLLYDELPDYLKGLDGLSELFTDFGPQTMAPKTGIPAKIIEQLTREFAKAKTAVCYGRMGVSVQAHGGLCQWMINLINILTGNLDLEGGAMFTNPAIDSIGMSRKGTLHKFNRWQSRIRKLPEFNGELPVAALAEDILTEGEGQIKAMMTVAGNPVLSTPNGTQLDKAFSTLDFMVSIDIYINETTRHADVILPPTTGLENDHYDLVFNTLATRNVAKYSPALFAAPKGTREDWQIYKELIRRFQKPSLRARLLDTFMTPQRMLAQGLRQGPQPVTLRQLKRAKHGMDLGPLQPSLPQRLFTKDKKIDLTPEIFANRLHTLDRTTTFHKELSLIGRRELRSNNSWMHNSQRLVKGPERCTLMIHPSDAEERNITDGQQVTVRSRVGSIELTADVTEQMMPGVVSIPHGWGHNREGTQWSVAEAHAGVSINDLTDDQLVDELTGNAALSNVPVEVAASN